LNRDGSNIFNADLEVQGCPWVWGNQSKLYENQWASARLQNIADSGLPIHPTNNTIVEGDAGPSYRSGDYNYTANPDSNIEFRAISLNLSQTNPFYLFTIIQNNVLKCDHPLEAVRSSDVTAGYYPSCRQ
jgi:hypothetical protein